MNDCDCEMNAVSLDIQSNSIDVYDCNSHNRVLCNNGNDRNKIYMNHSILFTDARE